MKVQLFKILCLGIAALITACNPQKNLTDPATVEKVPFNNRVMVTLKDGSSAEALEEKYAEYKLKQMGTTSKSQNKVIFEFDDTLITNTDMLNLLNKDKNVTQASRLLANTKKSTATKATKISTSVPIK